MQRLFASALSGALIAALALPSMAETTAQKYGWSAPQKPFRIYGNTWYVGSKGLSSILISSPQGLILFDGTLTGNDKLIEANIRALGFRVQDIKLIINSHAHSDHAGAIAAIQRDSGATVVASADGARALEAGGNNPADPQFSDDSGFPAIAHVRVAKDGEVIKLGNIAVTAHYTPGHTWGSTSWTWTSCEGQRCKAMAYVDSLTYYSNDTYHYTDPAHPERVQTIRHALDVVAKLPCDYLMVPHPNVIDFLEHAAQRKPGQPDPLDNPKACIAYAAEGQQNLQQRIQDEAVDLHRPPKH